MSDLSQPDRRRVFVIHGRNEPVRRALFAFLRSIGLDPIEWSQAIRMTGKASPYIGEILDAAFGAAQAIVVLETPDDVAYLHPSLTYPNDPECDPQLQPRPNVLFEAGMAMGRDPDRTVIVELGQVKVFSDVHGRHVIRLDNSVGKRQDLAERLQTAGCSVNLSGRDWHGTGDLNPPPPPGGGLPLGRKMPSSRASGVPRLDATYIENGGNRMDEIEVINHGPGDVYELEVTAEEKEGLMIRSNGDLPVPKLPAGKSVRVMRTRSLGSPGSSYFNVTVTGKTVDGTPIEQEIFVSGA
jgi:Predicted nucleotide-binding protein containing TIR-like domain